MATKTQTETKEKNSICPHRFKSLSSLRWRRHSGTAEIKAAGKHGPRTKERDLDQRLIRTFKDLASMARTHQRGSTS